MLTKIIMPPGGQTTNESLMVKWHKKVGDEVKKGDVLFEIETDKATLEIESYGEGELLAVNYNEGDTVSTGEVVAYIGTKGDVLPQDAGKTADVTEKDEYTPVIKKEPEKPDRKEEKEGSTAPLTAVVETGRVLASPAARYLAGSENIKLEDIAKSLLKQVIKKGDVKEYMEKSKEMDAEECYFIKTSAMRKVIARRMVESILAAPHYTVSMDIDMTECISLREMLNSHLKESGIKVSFNDIIMKCASKAIEKYPIINSSYDGDNIKVYRNVNFGLAVAVDGGLVVPVARQTNKKSLAEIAIMNMNNVDMAKNNKLQPADMSGGTITLSNLGMFGVDNFTAIINQPESCILAAGQIAEKPVSRDGQVISRQMMTITASFDHRVIDGACGASFLSLVKLFLEYPKFLIV